MPKLTIDGRAIEVEEGVTVIEAAERLGIMIPRFCWHEALGAAGACRMCAVMFEDGPVKGLQMSCMVPAADGMAVSTDHPEAQAFRAHVAEWLMLNHPHDCPICDEGGRCHLQDATISSGHSLRQYKGPKRTYPDQDLGPLLTHEMNRCIHCYRCVRFYQEYAGYRDLGVMKNANKVFYGRYESGRLESPFAGNLADICPTGVYTDRPSRHKGRRWDMLRGESVCQHCSLGCNLTPNVRYREIIRLEARPNKTVNGHFICDRGRYGFGYANLAERPRRARINGAESAMPEALKEAAHQLQAVAEKHGGKAVGLLASPRASLETLAAMKLLARETGWRAPEFFASGRERRAALAAAKGLSAETAVSMAGMADADVILVLGADPVGEAPMLALALRQAARQGALVAVVDPRPIFLPMEFTHLPVARTDMEAALAALVKTALAGQTPADPAMAAFMAGLPETLPTGLDAGHFSKTVERLGKAAFPVIVSGCGVVSETAPGFAAACARLLQSIRGKAGFFPLVPGPDGMGAAMALLDEQSSDDANFEGLLADIERGEVKALLAVEADFSAYPDRARLMAALSKLECRIVCDCLPSAPAKAAHVFLPARTAFETDAHFVNNEGRLQHSTMIFDGGEPLSQTGHGSHPPRAFMSAVPGGDPEPAWKIALTLLALAKPEATRKPEGEAPCPADAVACEGPEATTTDGGLLLVRNAPFVPVAPQTGVQIEGPFELLLVDATFGTEELSSSAPITDELAGPLELFLPAETAAALNLADDDAVLIPLGSGQVPAILRARPNMAPKTAVLPKRPEVLALSPGALVLAFDPAAIVKAAPQDGEGKS